MHSCQVVLEKNWRHSKLLQIKNTRRGISPDGFAAYDRASAAEAFLTFTGFVKKSEKTLYLKNNG